MTNIQAPPCPADLDSRRGLLLRALDERILVLDGATGTALQAVTLNAEDFGGPDLEGCNENLVRTRPDVVDGVHERYLRAGCDIVETNSFGGAPFVLEEYGLGRHAFELNRLSAAIARSACARHSTPDKPRFVCGSMGPTTKAISVTGGVTFGELTLNFQVQALGLMAGGADYLLLETCQDTRNIKAALLGIGQAFEHAGWKIPIAVSATIETMGTMLAGQDAEALVVSLLHLMRGGIGAAEHQPPLGDLLYVGLNCATGPELMTDHLRTMAELAKTRVALVPNAGLPDEDGCYHEGPEVFREVVGRFLEEGWLNLVGGCCGSTDDHVRALVDLVAGRPPRRVLQHARSFVSGLEAVELTADNRPLLVGERTNVLGSRKFKQLIAAGEFEAAAEVGRAQVRGGAQVLDICLQDPDRDEMVDVEAFLDKLVRLVRVPLMIDSTDHQVMERALTWCQGKALLNSINLEDGLERFAKVLPLALRYGAALVVGLIDEEGMAVTVERKLEVAHRSFRILTEEWGIPGEDIWFDPLVFPCGTGDEAYLGSAAATIEGVRRIKEELPGAKTILGISNVSFGLPPAGREALNAVFLYHNTKAGLDAAIVNTERLARYAEIPAQERELCESLLRLSLGDAAAGQAAVEAFTAHFRGRKSAADDRPPRASLPLDQRLARAVVEGSKEGLLDDLKEALADVRWPLALDIINGPLMAGMSEVGRLFNDNELIVAEVLQSAEVMKAAVSFLEQHMEKASDSSRGKVILATVKGDVHDIGKNLVDIILSNNGYEVVNLGIKVPSETLVQAVREHQPDVVGLSGLLVKSAQMMVTTAADFRAAGITVDMLVGGAALTRRFTHKRIAPEYGGVCAYAKDAMHGLSLVDRLRGDQRAALLSELRVAQAEDQRVAEQAVTEKAASAQVRSAAVRVDVPVLPPPDLERHVADLDCDAVWEWLNPQMLYAKHLGLKGSVAKLAVQGDEKYKKLETLVENLKAFCRSGEMKVRAVWQFFPAIAEGNTVRLLNPDRSAVIAQWEFPRQPGVDGLCLADFVLEGDHVALFVTTAGAGIRAETERRKSAGEYLASHGLAALALETAEAAAEWLHRELRRSWGIEDPPHLEKGEVLSARYRGKRYSFGYPACPDLSNQRALFELLRPQEVGVELTEGDMMDPEASVSAIVFSHPQARYFGV